ncbi:MAG: succinate dehydrogenase, cytochrome b556 subunit [Burkholderiaceae bacterium]
MSTPAAAPRTNRPEFRNIHVTQIVRYRMPPSAMVSILHRISGAALFLALPFLLWMFDLSLISEDSFARMAAISSHWIAKLALLFLIWAFMHHFVAGIRYLVLDLHVGLELGQARKNALAVFAISLPLTLLAALKLFGAF